MALQVAVCGPRCCTDADAEQARRVGELLAEHGAVVICGGGAGVMAAVAAGARSKGGLVIGVRPNDSKDGASPDLSATIVTNMGEARNAIIVWSADAVISVGGSWGTLSEIALAMRRGEIPVGRSAAGGSCSRTANRSPVSGTWTRRMPLSRQPSAPCGPLPVEFLEPIRVEILEI